MNINTQVSALIHHPIHTNQCSIPVMYPYRFCVVSLFLFSGLAPCGVGFSFYRIIPPALWPLTFCNLIHLRLVLVFSLSRTVCDQPSFYLSSINNQEEHWRCNDVQNELGGKTVLFFVKQHTHTHIHGASEQHVWQVLRRDGSPVSCIHTYIDT